MTVCETMSLNLEEVPYEFCNIFSLVMEKTALRHSGQYFNITEMVDVDGLEVHLEPLKGGRV